MTTVHSFAPLSAPGARVLILGSMPGKASLAAEQYYAHPRNAFWPIMAAIYGFAPTLPYPARVAHLLAQNVAVWDVARLCTRASSLDSDIVNASVIANDFGQFFTTHPEVEKVCLNGAKAAELYRRHVLRRVPEASRRSIIRLPSTSPAYAAMSFEAKLQQWRRGLALGPSP